MVDTELPRSANLLVDIISNEPALLEKLKTEPVETLKEAAAIATKHLPPPAYVQDRAVYRIVVGSLGLVAIIAAVGAIYLAAGGANAVVIPDILTALGSAAIGALAGLLAPSPK